MSDETISLINKPLIPETLQSFEYYKRKLPLYLRQSGNFLEHFRIWYDLLTKTIVTNSESLINLLNIFADDYFDLLEEVEGVGKLDTESDILDKLGNLFGITRTNNITYIDENNNEQNEILTLTNEDFLIVIKARIIQNYCDGTRKTIQSFYDTLGLDDGLTIRMLNNPGGSNAYVMMYLVYTKEHAFSSLDKLFLAGLLNIESMGITYVYSQPIIADKVVMWIEDSVVYVNADNFGDDTYYIYNDSTQTYTQALSYDKDAKYYILEDGNYISVKNGNLGWGGTYNGIDYDGGLWL